MAYCAIAVNVGSFNDPPHRQGLAHFLEHMIFMGSEKYPAENDFSDFIA
jgi:secreted Zn-dependent insulinase-like peptidase